MKKILMAAAMAFSAAAMAQGVGDSTQSMDIDHAGDTAKSPATLPVTTEDATRGSDDQLGTGGSGTEGTMAKPEAKPEMKPGMKADAKMTAPAMTDPNAFLNELAAGNEMELKMAQLAKDKATNKDVKAHAERMLKDHGQMKTEVEKLAQTMNLTLAEPKPADDKAQKMMDAHMANMAKLEVLEGAAFDQAYLDVMIGDHDETLAALMMASESFKDNEVGKLTKKAIPTVMAHRDLTYKLLGKLKPDLTAMKAMPKTQGRRAVQQ